MTCVDAIAPQSMKLLQRIPALPGPFRSFADAEIERARTGQAIAALITTIALGAAIYFFAVDNPVAGGVLLSVPVIMLVRAFLGRS